MDQLHSAEYTERLSVPKNFGGELHTRMRCKKNLLKAKSQTLSEVSKFTHCNGAYQACAKLRELGLIMPPPIEGRVHVPVQTSIYLEELCEPVNEQDIACQADSFLDSPLPPYFVPSKTGIDVGTQIDEGELFDFETEVVPILDAFVTYILEQSLLEVIQEEEVAELREQQRRFEELHICELTEKQHLAEQYRRENEERKQHFAKQMGNGYREDATFKVNVGEFSSACQYATDLIPAVFNRLEKQDFYVDEAQHDYEDFFWPWLMRKVDKEIASLSKSFHLLNTLMKDNTEVRSEHKDEVENKPKDDDDDAIFQAFQKFRAKALVLNILDTEQFCAFSELLIIKHDSSCFHFSGTIYMQTLGLPMGNHLLSLLIDIFLENLERRVLSNFLEVKLWG